MLRDFDGPATQNHALETLFWPGSVAVVGASPDITRVRGEILHLLVTMGYPGRVFPVNRSYEDIHGLRCYPTIGAIGQPVDLAIIAIPAAAVLEAVEEAVAAGARNILIVSSGFAEAGEAASVAQRRIGEIARQSGVRIVGPNSEGFHNAIGNVAATFSPAVKPRPEEDRPLSPRRVGVIAQSGGIGFALYSRGLAAGLDFSYVISTGNETSLTMADILDYMVHDPRTDIVMIFCEAIRDPALFLKVAGQARALGKPIIAVKVGASEAASRAAASHTASMTGWQDAYAAAFERFGIIQVDDPGTAVAVAGMLAGMPPLAGRRVAVVTVSGGGGAWMSDALEAAGFDVPLLSEPLQQKLRAFMPAHGSASNPVDITAQGSKTGDMATSAIETLETSDEIDAIVYVCSLASEKRISLIAERVAAIVARRRKPLMVWGYTPASDFGRRTLARAGVFGSTDLLSATRALSKVAAYEEGRGAWLPPCAAEPQPIAIPPEMPDVLSEYRAKQLLSSHGILACDEVLAASAAEAGDAAERLGFPVAMKVQSPDLPHKTEAGAVRIRIADRDAAMRAHDEMLASARRYRPDARIEGVLVQKMAPGGVELIVGMVDDPTFGAIMMVGSGGVLAELVTDKAHRLAPVSPGEAMTMLRSLKSAKLFDGYRGAAAIDLAPVADFISQVSELAASPDRPIREMEFNPVIVHSDGSGMSVADGLIALHARKQAAG